MKKNTLEEMTIMEAVDNLSDMAELDEKKISSKDTPQEEVNPYRWLDPKHKEKAMTRVKGTFQAVHDYLKDIYNKDNKYLTDIEMQKGIQSIMVLAGEAAKKIDTCFKNVQDEKVSEFKEYRNLHKFYFMKTIKRFHDVLQSEEIWIDEWETGEEDIRDIQRVGLRDLEMVKRDRKYELFFIRKEDGNPYFNKNLIRHIKLVSDFDEVIFNVEGDDPLLKIQLLKDKDAYETARDIRMNIESYLEEFYRNALKYKDNQLISITNKAVMALMLATNPLNLLQHTSGKNCQIYLYDFQVYLREVLNSEDYLHRMSNVPEESDHLNQSTLRLIHVMCFYFFTHRGMKQDTTRYIYDLIQKGSGGEKALIKDFIFFLNTLLENYENTMNILKRYPNGPLFRALDFFSSRESLIFDPIGQENYPQKLYEFSSKSLQSTCLKLPCPTQQSVINKAIILNEFKGYLRHLIANQKQEKLLIFNFQDRTTWEEHARAKVIEELQHDAEFSKYLFVVTLPKKTDFYYQTDVYLAVNDASDFTRLLKEQLESREECGFYFPLSLSSTEINCFIKDSIPLIHQLFFMNKKNLTRKNRLDFIEIFYHFFMMKVIDMTRAQFVSFSCKDGIDIGSTAAGSFYAFLKIMSTQPTFDEVDREFMNWMLFAPALLIRERVVDMHRLNRMVSTLSVTNAELRQRKDEILEAFQKLYDFTIFTDMHLTASS